MQKKTIVKLATASLLLGGIVSTPLLNTTPLSFNQVVYADDAAVQSLMVRINKLPDTDELNESHAEEVKGIMQAYADLKLADRVKVTNYEILQESFDALVDKGFLTNEDNTALQEQKALEEKQANRDISDVAVSQAKEYTFASNGQSGITVLIRYTTDANGDGQGDAPTRILLTAPDGTTYPITNTSVSMSDGDKLKVDLTWADLFLQLDFSALSEGNWTIETSQAVTFSSKEFAGVASDINAEEPATEEPIEKEAESKPKKSIFPLLILISIIGLAGFAIWKFISIMRAPVAPTVDESNLPKENEPKRLSDEEQLALMKEEYRRQMEDTNEEISHQPTETKRDLLFDPTYMPTRCTTINYDDDDPEDSQKSKAAETTPATFAMEEEEDTGVLKKEDKPTHLVDEASSFMDEFDI